MFIIIIMHYRNIRILAKDWKNYIFMNEWMNEWMYNSIKLANQLSSLLGNQKEEKWLNVDLIQILNFLSLN